MAAFEIESIVVKGQNPEQSVWGISDIVELGNRTNDRCLPYLQIEAFSASVKEGRCSAPLDRCAGKQLQAG